MLRGASIAAVFGVLVAAPVSAGSEEGERRLTLAGAAESIAMDAYGTTGRAYAGGAGAAFGYGVRRWLDVSVSVLYLTRPDVTLRDPAIVGVSGSELTLFADLHVVEAAAGARLLWVTPRFTRWHPLLELRTGVTLRRLTSAQVFSAGLIAEPAAETAWIPFMGASAGFVYRASDHVQLGALATSNLGTAGHRTFGASLELSWETYDLL